MSDYIEVTILKNSGYWALEINGTRYGPDAGPWKAIATFKIEKDELYRMINEDNVRG